MELSPKLRAKLEARGLDPDDTLASLLEDAERMIAEIRAGTFTPKFLPVAPLKHGTSRGWISGCRCAPCKAYHDATR